MLGIVGAGGIGYELQSSFDVQLSSGFGNYSFNIFYYFFNRFFIFVYS